MNKRSELSSALRITNVNDFLAPANSCVLPVAGGALPAPAGSVLSPIVPSQISATTTPQLKATVTVSDCLACSGCVTSAETVLLSTENIDVLNGFAQQRNKTGQFGNTHFAIAALSQQSVASIANHFNLSLDATARRISRFFKDVLHFDAVFDNSLAVQVSLLESASEFIQRWRQGKKITLTSACPGWLTYAEKTQDAIILDAISSVRSAQGIVGALAKSLMTLDDKRPTWVLSVAQCHDKKLEAIRSELTTLVGMEQKRQVDCVLTTGELVDVMNQHSFDLLTTKGASLDDVHQLSCVHKPFGVAVGSGSDGYAEYVLRRAAKEILGVEVGPGDVQFEKSSKSGDVRVATVEKVDGSRTLRFATAYGFRSLQSILRKIRKGECPYNYIELMACPGGCNNGGGQLSPPDLKQEDARSAKQQNADHLDGVHEKFFEAPRFEDPTKVPGVREFYKDRLGESVGSALAMQRTRLKIQSRKEGTAASFDW